MRLSEQEQCRENAVPAEPFTGQVIVLVQVQSYRTPINYALSNDSLGDSDP
jgi:hypothetical protein